MRNPVAAIFMSLILVTAVTAMPGSAQSQVVIVIGNGSAQPYYPPPYPYPYPYPYAGNQVVVAESQYYSGYSYPAPVYGYGAPYYARGYRPYRYGW